MQNSKDKEPVRLNAEAKDRGFVSQLTGQIRKMQLKDWMSLFLLGISFIPGKIWKLLNHHLWVVSEYEGLARDNGYWFFKYIRDNYPDKPAFYPIARGASDESKIDALGNRIIFSSFKHYMLFWAAEKQFTSSKNAGFPSRICEDLVQWHFHRFQYVLLNHGITKGKSTVVDASKTNYDYILTCSDLDREIIIKDNNQPESKVLSLGFARHDNLNNELTENNTILIMPTWRINVNIKFCRNKEERRRKVNEFLSSSYYIKYMSLLNNERLKDFLNKNDLKLVFYLHDYAQGFTEYFKTDSDRIIIAHSEDYDIQTLLKRAALLITDYSSVCYDFAYMYKPVIYYQFDLEDFEYFQYKAGEHYSYEKDGVGKICFEENAVVESLEDYHVSGFAMPSIYKKRVDKYFTHHDQLNCKRIYDRFCR